MRQFTDSYFSDLKKKERIFDIFETQKLAVGDLSTEIGENEMARIMMMALTMIGMSGCIYLMIIVIIIIIIFR